MCTNIAGLLRNTKGKNINFLSHKGRMLTDKEARAALAELQAKGHKLIGSDDCVGFDPFGGGCPGHDVEDVPIENETPVNATSNVPEPQTATDLQTKLHLP